MLQRLYRLTSVLPDSPLRQVSAMHGLAQQACFSPASPSPIAAAWIDPLLPWGKKHEIACHSEVCRKEKAFQKTGTTDDSAHGNSVV